MPGVTQKNASQADSPYVSGSRTLDGFRLRLEGDLSYEQLQKFWSELSPAARKKLLRIDKQTLLEQARKNLYCSRCNGLLLEGYSQIIVHGKSLQHDDGVNCERRAGNIQNESADRVAEVASLYCQDDTHDPLVHPWGGLVTTRDGMLTLLDCFLQGESLDKLQSVFDSARAREHERELLYPDACGGEGRGWISQGLINYGKGHGLRETCALHTSRLSCATLVDFWSALGKETRYSLLQMNEDDFIERLVYRFDNKKFCRDCRKNVIREFKELKELKRIRRESHCNNWFCVADTAFQYEVSGTSIRADWHQSFCEVADAYHHFECAVGTGEGKSDISGFEDVGMCWKYKVDGLDLDGLTACFITLRAWRLDGRCIELYVKAHALKGQPCVHRRLVVGDGFVTINTGDNIRTFFEHAEDAEEEDDDNSVDSDGNDLDGDGSRPQKHAKSPELAREFLSDAATVIFKEQVEKAFREGTARQNAHSIFVSLALKLLEDRIHVACKDIIALQKQIKLLEEEEKEKCDKERRKERRKTKEREKKLRRKEKMKEKENEADNKNIQSGNGHSLTASTNNSSVYGEDESCHASGLVDSIQEKDHTMPAILHSPRILEGEVKSMGKNCLQYSDMVDEVFSGGGNINIVSPEPIILPPGNMKFKKKKNLLDPAPKSYGVCDPVTVDESHDYIEDLYEEVHSHREISSRNVNGSQRNSRNQFSRASFRTYPPKFNGQKTYGGHHSRSSSRISHSAYRVKANQATVLRSSFAANIQTISVGNTSRPLWNDEKFNGRFSSGGRSVSRGNGALLGYTNSVHGEVHTKQVWEPLASRRNCDGSNSNSSKCSDAQKDERNAENSNPKSSTKNQPSDTSQHSIKHCVVDKSNCHGCTNDLKISSDLPEDGKKTCDREAVSCVASSNDGINCVSDPSLSTSCSDSSTSCLSEGDFSTATSCIQNTESLSTSDSEDASPLQSIGSTLCGKDSIQHSPDVVVDCGVNTGIWDSFETTTSLSSISDNRFPTLQSRQTFVAQQNETISHSTESKFEMEAQKHLDGMYSQTTASSAPVLDQCLNRFSAWPPRQTCYAEGNETVSYPTESNFETEPHQHLHAMHNQSFPFPVFPSHNMGYYHTTASWPTLATNALLPFPHSDGHCGLTTNRPYDHHMMSDRMTYGDFHPLAPALNIGQVQFYPFESKGMRSKEYGMASNMRMCGAVDTGLLDETGAVKKVNGNFERSFSNHDQICSEASLHLLHGDHRNFPSDGDRVFSLFHFGSKAVGSELKPFSVSSLKNDVIDDIRSHSKLSPPGKADLAQTKKEGIMEEYSLFAPDNSYLHFFN